MDAVRDLMDRPRNSRASLDYDALILQVIEWDNAKGRQNPPKNR